MCTFSMDPASVASHSKGSRYLLRRALVVEWIAFLERLSDIMPQMPVAEETTLSEAKALLAKRWNNAVSDALKRAKADLSVKRVVEKLLTVDAAKRVPARYPSKEFAEEIAAAQKVRASPLSDEP